MYPSPRCSLQQDSGRSITFRLLPKPAYRNILFASRAWTIPGIGAPAAWLVLTALGVTLLAPTAMVSAAAMPPAGRGNALGAAHASTYPELRLLPSRATGARTGMGGCSTVVDWSSPIPATALTRRALHSARHRIAELPMWTLNPGFGLLDPVVGFCIAQSDENAQFVDRKTLTIARILQSLVGLIPPSLDGASK